MKNKLTNSTLLDFKNIVFIAICSLFVTGCGEDDNCPSSYDMGSFVLLEDSKALIPYFISESFVVFSDESGNEIIANKSETETETIGRFNKTAPCVENEGKEVDVKAEVEHIFTTIEIPALDIELFANYIVEVNFIDYEDELVYDNAVVGARKISTTISGPPPSINLTLDPRTTSKVVQIPEPVMTINGTDFFDVFTNTTGSESIAFYYNHQFGFVGFKDVDAGVVYGFERFE